jgi:hypothetical protein
LTLEEVKVLASAALLPEVLERAWRAAKLPVPTKTQRVVCFGSTMAILAWWQGFQALLTGLGAVACAVALTAVFFIRPYGNPVPPMIAEAAPLVSDSAELACADTLVLADALAEGLAELVDVPDEVTQST